MTEPGRTRATPTGRIQRLDDDATTTVVVVVIAVVLALFDSAEQLGLTLGAIAVGGLALTQKRRFPVTVLAICVLLAILTIVVGGAFGGAVLVLDALYIVGRFASNVPLRVVQGLVTVAILAAFVVPLALGATLREGVFFSLQALAIFATPLWWASSVRQSAELAHVQGERADAAERLLVLEREEAVRDERERMARDLHDVVAANLSAIAITSEAALAGPTIAEREAAALQAIRSSALDGLDEKRSMILILRSGDLGSGGEVAAAPRLAQVPDIVAAVDAVDATLIGEVPSASAATEQALARVVAEAVANAERHSPGAAVEVRFDEDADAISVVVTSTGGELIDGAPGTGNGLGLIRERAERLGGRLEAGPIAGGRGWRVRARVPRNAGDAERGGEQSAGRTS